MLKEKSFTLVEILIVVVVIVILAALALPGFGVTKERTLDKEAKTTLLLIKAAENIYKMETGFYFPKPIGVSTVISDLNSNLKVNLPASGANWKYIINNSTAGSEVGTAARVGAGGRSWNIALPSASSDTPSCSGTGCP